MSPVTQLIHSACLEPCRASRSLAVLTQDSKETTSAEVFDSEMLPGMRYRGELVFTHDPKVGAECNLLLILACPDLHSVQTVWKVQLFDDVFLLTSEVEVWRDYGYQRILLFVLS